MLRRRAPDNFARGKMSFRPTPAAVHAFLRGRNALLVHFSGSPKGAGRDRGADHLFPKDLLHVIAGRASSGLSCSVVRPGDVFRGFARNATGAIGVVLDLRSAESLIAVSPSDLGSGEDAAGNRVVSHERDITLGDLEDTLDRRANGDYNEWVVRDFRVRGVFAGSPPQVSVLVEPQFPEEVPDWMREPTLVPGFRRVNEEELFQTFPGLPLYTFSSTGIVRRTIDGAVVVSGADIYPP